MCIMGLLLLDCGLTHRINLAFVSWTRTNYNGLSYLLFAVVLLLFSIASTREQVFLKALADISLDHKMSAHRN